MLFQWDRGLETGRAAIFPKSELGQSPRLEISSAGIATFEVVFPTPNDPIELVEALLELIRR